MSEALSAEFDTVAQWTARIALDLGPDFYIPAACRGSGSPAALDWLLEKMALDPGDSLLDCGAGVGGPAAHAAHTRGVRPLLVEPEEGACRAARMLFDHNVIQSAGTALPLADAAVDAAWALGVLCTTGQQATLLSELRRVVRPGRPIGLLVFVAAQPVSADYVQDNHFPTRSELTGLLSEAKLTVETQLRTSELPAIPAAWSDRVQTVDRALEAAYGHTPAWQIADRQSRRIGRLLADGGLHGALMVVRADPLVSPGEE